MPCNTPRTPESALEHREVDAGVPMLRVAYSFTARVHEVDGAARVDLDPSAEETADGGVREGRWGSAKTPVLKKYITCVLDISVRAARILVYSY